MKRIIAFFFWLLLIGGGYAAYDAHHFLTTPASDQPQEIMFTVAPGATFDRVAWDLKKAGALTDVTRFRLLARYKDVLGKIRAGEYMINTGWTPEQVLWQVTMGQPVLYRMSIREGLTWWETAREVEAQGFARYEDFKAVIHDPEFLSQYNIPFANAEGFLFPETYLMRKPRAMDRAQAREVAALMVDMFWKKTQPIWTQLPRKQDAKASPGSGPGSEPGAGPAGTARPAPGAENATAPSAVSLAPVAGSMGSLDGSGQRQSAPGNATQPIPAGNAARPATAVPAGQRPAGSLAANATASAAPTANATTGAASAANASAVPATAPPAAPVPNAGNATASLSGGNATAAPSAGNATIPAATATPLPTLLNPADVDPEALKRLVILATLVEKETGIPSERVRVAGVYANRLRLGMLLQCDPTIIYGVGESFSGSIRRSQLNDAKNLYNTYIHAGLPPGPICSPGLDALKAAAAPERHDFLYFVATGVDGGHSFSKTLNDHNKAVQIYRNRMREQQ